MINTVLFCTFHDIRITVSMHVFRCGMNKICDITNVTLSGNIIDYTKYLGILLCSDMEPSIDISCQTNTF